MNYIFFGTPDFAATILRRLIGADMIPVGIVTNPDRPTGRKKIITAPPVKKLLLSLRKATSEASRDEAISTTGILQPETLDEQFIEQLKKINADVGVLAAYGKIIPQSVIDVFAKGIIVVHPSLLPKYRGATPIQSALLAGETKTGTTLIVMDEKVDHGKIISNFQLPISNDDTYETLAKKLAEVSADLLIETLPKYLSGEIIPQTQDHAQATYTKKLTSTDGYINPSDLYRACHPDEPPGEEGSMRKQDASQAQHDTTISIHNKIRALNPEPGVWTTQNGRRLKLLAAEIVDGKLVLRKTQFEGETPK